MGGASGDYDYEVHALRQAQEADAAMVDFLRSLPAEMRRELADVDVRGCGDVGLTRDVADNPLCSITPEYGKPSWRMQPDDVSEAEERLRDEPEADALSELFRVAIPSQDCACFLIGFAIRHQWRAAVFGIREACEMTGFQAATFRRRFIDVWRVESLTEECRTALHGVLDEIMAGGDIRVRLAAVSVACGWCASLGIAASLLAAFCGCTRQNLSKESIASKRRLGIRENLFGKSDSAREIFRQVQLERHWRKVGRSHTAPEWLS